MVILCTGVNMDGSAGSGAASGAAMGASMGPWGAVAGGVIGGIAGAIGGKSKFDRANYEAQKEFAKKGIRWRVGDAKAAGVHPLYALGAQTAGYSPTAVIGDSRYADAGQAVGNAVAAASDVAGRALQKAQLVQMSAQSENDFAQASYWKAQTAKMMQDQNNTSPWPNLITDQDTYKRSVDDPLQVYNPYSDAIVRRANPEIFADIDSSMAKLSDRGGISNDGRATDMWQLFDTGSGDIILPTIGEGQGLMEALEGLDVKYWPAVMAENKRRYGQEGLNRLLRLYDPLSKGPAYSKKKGKAPADSFQQLPAW